MNQDWLIFLQGMATLWFVTGAIIGLMVPLASETLWNRFLFLVFGMFVWPLFIYLEFTDR